MTLINFQLSEEQYKELTDELIYHNDLYYNQSHTEITDEEYDNKFQLLVSTENLHPEWITPNSPSQKLVGQNSKQKEFQKAVHQKPLLSLENTYNAEDIKDWYGSIERVLQKMTEGTSSIGFSLEPKYDGISVELIYKQWKFVQAITRWDGMSGDDITANVMTINSVPKIIPYQEELHLRGEIVMPKSVFEKLNEERAKAGEALFANPRNAASGSIKQLDTSVTASRKLLCYVYDVL